MRCNNTHGSMKLDVSMFSKYRLDKSLLYYPFPSVRCLFSGCEQIYQTVE